MDKGDWAILGILALIWGGAFIFIGIAVRHVHPLTYVWLRLSIAALAMWAFLLFKGEKLGLPRPVWGSILLLAVLNNALPFTLFGWGQTHIASGLAAILNATTPIWGVLVAHVFTHDERMRATQAFRSVVRTAAPRPRRTPRHRLGGEGTRPASLVDRRMPTRRDKAMNRRLQIRRQEGVA